MEPSGMPTWLIAVLSYGSPVVVAAVAIWLALRREHRAETKAAAPPPKPFKPRSSELILRRRVDGFDVFVDRDPPDLRIEIDSRGRIDGRLMLRPETRLDGVAKLAGTEDLRTGDRSFDERFLVQGPESVALAILGKDTRARLLRLSGRVALRLEEGVLRCVSSEPRLSRHQLEQLVKDLTGLASQLSLRGTSVTAAVARNASSDPIDAVRLRNLRVFLTEARSDRELARVAKKALHDRNPSIRMLAAKLAGNTEKAFGALVAILQDPRGGDTHRVEALQQLVDAFAYRSALYLPIALDAGIAELRIAALDAVGLVRERSLLSRVRELARATGKSPDAPSVASRAARALGKLEDSQAEPLLLELLEHESDDVRREAAVALGAVGSVRSVEALLPLTAVVLGSGEVRAAARDAIQQIQSRLGDAGAGRVSLTQADPAAGGLSLSGTRGELSIPAGASTADGKIRDR